MNIMNENIFEHETHNLTMKRDAMKKDKTHFYKTGQQNDFEDTMNKILYSRFISSPLSNCIID